MDNVKPETQPAVAVGFDRVLADYQGQGDAFMGGPRPGAREFLLSLRKLGFFVVVVSGRVRDQASHDEISDWLKANRMPYDEVWNRVGVPTVVYHVDDHNVHIRGNPSPGDFNATLQEITNREDRVH